MNTEKICCSWYNQNFNFQILPKTNQLIGIKLYIHAVHVTFLATDQFRARLIQKSLMYRMYLLEMTFILVEVLDE